MTWTKMNIKNHTSHVFNTGNSLQCKQNIEKYHLSSNYNNPVLKPCVISLDIINCYENTGPNIGE